MKNTITLSAGFFIASDIYEQFEDGIMNPSINFNTTIRLGKKFFKAETGMEVDVIDCHGFDEFKFMMKRLSDFFTPCYNNGDIIYSLNVENTFNMDPLDVMYWILEDGFDVNYDKMNKLPEKVLKFFHLWEPDYEIDEWDDDECGDCLNDL